jgi:hypothetical protein
VKVLGNNSLYVYLFHSSGSSQLFLKSHFHQLLVLIATVYSFKHTFFGVDHCEHNIFIFTAHFWGPLSLHRGDTALSEEHYEHPGDQLFSSNYSIYNQTPSMPYHATTKAVVFDEGLGYFLVKALTHRQRAQSYIARSLDDGQLYTRKKLTADYVNLVPHSDIKLAKIVHPQITLELVYSTQYTHVKDALYFKFCNGGDLRQVIDLYAEKWETIPEDFIWHWLKTVGFTGGGLLRVYSCSDIVANRFSKAEDHKDRST